MKNNAKKIRRYKYYTDYRKTLEKYILLNSIFYQILFLIFMFVLYIVGFKTDGLSLFINFIISIFILDGVRLKIKSKKLFDDWDNQFKTKTGYFKKYKKITGKK